MFSDLKKQVYYFINHKWYMLSIFIAAVAGYGYEITHTSMGIDDVCIEMYFEDGLGVAIGRWPFYLINKVFHVTSFEPFIMEFITVLFMILAAVLWCALIREILPQELPMVCYIAFATMFLDYSIIAEVFVYYLQNGIGFIYCLIAIALFGFYKIQTGEVDRKGKISGFLCISGMVCLAISFYESAATLFLFGICMVMMIDGISENHMKVNQFKKLAEHGVLAVIVSVVAIIGRSLMTTICMSVFEIASYNYRSIGSVLEILKSKEQLIRIAAEIIRDYFAVGAQYYPIGLFIMATVIFWIVVVYWSYKKRNICLIFVAVAAYSSIFVLSIAQKEAIPYRANQTLSVFVAWMLMVVCCYVLHISKEWIRVTALVLVFSTVYNSAFDLNHWFALEYKRNQIEIEAVHRIIYDLQRGDYDIATKPVVFVGKYNINYAILKEYSMTDSSFGYELVKKMNAVAELETPDVYPYVQVISYSFIDWAVTSFSTYKGNNSMIHRLFIKEGFSHLWGGDEYYQKGLEKKNELSTYPQDGYIKEYEDFILVRLHEG